MHVYVKIGHNVIWFDNICMRLLMFLEQEDSEDHNDDDDMEEEEMNNNVLNDRFVSHMDSLEDLRLQNNKHHQYHQSRKKQMLLQEQEQRKLKLKADPFHPVVVDTVKRAIEAACRYTAD